VSPAQEPANRPFRRGIELLDQVDYRLARTEAEKDAIYRLRYRAYLQEGAIEPNRDRRVTDRFDDLPNSWIFGVYFDGKVMSRSSVMAESKKDRDIYKSAANERLAVHTYGPNVAVVVGTAHEKGTGKDGKPFDRKFRFTDTWVERGGRWQCVASQIMKLP